MSRSRGSSDLVKVTLTIDRSLRELADRYGVNLSMLLELALIRYFYKMHGIVVRTRRFEKYVKEIREMVRRGEIELPEGVQV